MSEEVYKFRLHPRREKPVTPKDNDVDRAKARREIERLDWIKEWGHSEEWDDSFHH